MNRPHFRNSADRHDEGRDAGLVDKGFTLVEILIAIVLVGILSAVVVVGISNLTSKGSTSACQASADAAKAGAVVYFASVSPSVYPPSLSAMTVTAGGNPAALTLPSGVTVAANANVTSGGSWVLTMLPGATGVPPTFTCANNP